MTVAVITLAVALAGAIVAIVYLASVAIARADAAGAAAGQVGQRTGELEVAAKQVTEANAATTAAAAAAHVQEQRGDTLEKEVSDEEHPPGSGLDRLSKLTGVGATGTGPGPGAGRSGS
jgi:hypothetical protein